MELTIPVPVRSPFLYIVIFYIFIVCTHSRTTNYGPSSQSEAYFNGSSYVRLQSTISLKKQTGLSFRTCYGGSLFSQQQNDDLIELSVHAEGVTFIARTGGKIYEHKIMGNFLNNQWHTVYLQYRLGNLTIDVDGDVQLIANASYRNELLVSPGLYNEGAAVLLIGKQFNGCLLEGPSIVFDPALITSSHNVIFEPCPIPLDNCDPKEKILSYDFCRTEPCMRHGTCINGQKTYTCACLPRYTGKNCEIDLGNPCERKPPICKNSATCIPDVVGDYSCVCAPGFTGKLCEHEITIDPKCKPNPCLNGGICEYDIETDDISCRCKAGYGGSNCEVNIDECASSPCLNGGICMDGFNNFTCDCSHTGYKGSTCEININECVANPCLNQGTCFDTYGSYLCQCLPGFGGKNCQFNIDECSSQPCFHDGICVSRSGAYECRCHPGYLGDHCEIEQSKQRQCDPKACPQFAECVDVGNAVTCVCKPEYPGDYPNCNVETSCGNTPCLNGGICNPIKGTCSCPDGFTGLACERLDSCKPDGCLNGGSLVRNLTSFKCFCADGWTGKHCETRLFCSDKPCVHAFKCHDYLGGYLCTCRPGWTGVKCDIKLGFCTSEPCMNFGQCVDDGKGFHCVCSAGFEGPFCQKNIDECLSNPCLNGGICKDNIDGFTCNCTDRWMGLTCEKPYDICEFYPCKNNGTCRSSGNKREYTCQCLSGFDGDNCEINIDDCRGNKCPPGQICIDLVNDYECRCPPGYAGDDCSIDLDPCAKEPCINGTCLIDKTTHQFSCKCFPGYAGTLCNVDIDECQVSNNKICNHGICVNSEGSFQCYCKPGYTGERCNLDFDECLSMPCHNNATCINLINDYECHCPAGYEGKDCSLNIDECVPMPCMKGSTCIDGINEYTCVCQEGLTGKRCEVNIDECESAPCQNGARCLDGLNNYTCDCTDTGYEGAHCENNIDDCKGNPCQNGAQCIDDVKDYQCKCYKGYSGKNCEIDINECESNPCQHNGTCLELSNMTLYNPSITSQMDIQLPETFNRPFNFSGSSGYECLCVPGVTGENCEININECESNPCLHGNCVDKIGGYECECEEGYEGVHCEQDIDECVKFNPCQHGTCIDRVANYFCQCEPLYGGKNCSVELEGCLNRPCLNDGLCHAFLVNENEHKFNCSCPHGFHGHTCEKRTTMSLTGNSSVIVNTTREEGYDIQFRFKTTLSDGLLALGKGATFCILELSKGRLNLHTSLLNKWEGVFIGSNLNNGKWQKVFVAINSTHLVLSANDEQTIYPINYNDNNNVSTSFPVTYIGGVPSNLRKITHGQPFLVGCTEDVLINGQWVLPEDKPSNWVSFQNVEVGCSREPQCEPNPCKSGGFCTDRWIDFSCTCTRPYLGRTCQYNYTAATFGYENITDSLVTVDVADYARKAVRISVQISMFIRTRQSRGQLFYLGSGLVNSSDENYIAAQLEGGDLLVKIQFNGYLEAYAVGGVKLDDGENHLIEVVRNVASVQVRFDGMEYFRKTISATGNLDAQVLYLGGQPQSRSVRQTNENLAALKVDIVPPTASAAITSAVNSVHFKGIIQDVQISNGNATMVVEFFPLEASDIEIPLPFGTVTFDKATVLPGVRSDDSCKVNPCHHNGECQNTWNDYICVCPRGFKGKECKELEFCELEGCPAESECQNLEDGYECTAISTFNGLQTPLQYHLTVLPTYVANVMFDTMELNYRSRSWGTILFGKHNEDYFVVFMYHNEIVVQWYFKGKGDVRRFRKDAFEGQWISLLFTIKHNIFMGGLKENVLDESPDFEVENFDDETFTEIFKDGQIYVAGSDGKSFDYQTVIENTDLNMTGYIPSSDTTTAESVISNTLDVSSEDVLLYKVDQDKKTDNFKGCLGEIRIGRLLLPYFPTKEIYRNETYAKIIFELETTSPIEHGCTLCYDSDCFNEGFCINSKETYKCNCPPGYTADDCSIDINECENNQCQNNATCVDLIAKYECKCLPGYEGEFCESNIDECLSNPCRHGGTCIDLIGNFKCDCPDNYVGRQCEAPLLITCHNQPCHEGATCETGTNKVTGNNFTCICAEGMEGLLCDTPFCIRQHCEQGHCNTTGLVPYCQCQNGFEGQFCETDINECLLPNGESPCQNGGICIDGIDRYDCNCNGTGYTGLLCEQDIDECKMRLVDCGRAGTCENMPGSYRCICDSIKGKCGYQCDLDDPCETDRPCEHGTCQSKCTDVPDYFCQCENEFTGKNCTELKVSASQAGGGFNILYIAIPLVLIVIVGFTIGMIVLVNIARSKRATRGTYSPSAQEFCNPRVELDHVLKPPPEERLI